MALDEAITIVIVLHTSARMGRPPENEDLEKEERDALDEKAELKKLNTLNKDDLIWLILQMRAKSASQRARLEEMMDEISCKMPDTGGWDQDGDQDRLRTLNTGLMLVKGLGPLRALMEAQFSQAKTLRGTLWELPNWALPESLRAFPDWQSRLQLTEQMLDSTA